MWLVGNHTHFPYKYEIIVFVTAKITLKFVLFPNCTQMCVITYTNKCKEKLVILQLIGIIVIKSKETRVLAHLYTPADILVGI